ncbi:MAG: 50S ribosomal protein L6 [Robiginitomaculum sp.]|nr:MAG: 50S ribosomal protein L6 [Robiginitomaculum sp.]
MSRIGKKPVEIPSGVTAELNNKSLKIKGPKGELGMTFVKEVNIKLEGNLLTVTAVDESQRARAMWGLQRSLAANLIEGVTKGYQKELELRGVGYRAQMKGKNIVMQLGFSHEVNYTPCDGVTLATPKPTQITVTGMDKQAVGQTAAEIRRFRKPEPYKGKGVRYVGEFVRSKEGKKK